MYLKSGPSVKNRSFPLDTCGPWDQIHQTEPAAGTQVLGEEASQLEANRTSLQLLLLLHKDIFATSSSQLLLLLLLLHNLFLFFVSFFLSFFLHPEIIMEVDGTIKTLKTIFSTNRWWFSTSR